MILHKRLILIILIILFSGLGVKAVTLDELSTPKPPAYRVGTTDNIEKEYKVVDLTQKKSTKKSSYEKEYIKNITYSDSTLKELSKEISKLMEMDKQDMLEDVQILWMGAATKSETIKFALFKLSNPDADKPDESIVKKIVRPLASITSIAGTGFMSPIAASSAIMSGSLINSLTFNDKDLNYKFSKVNDADMIILIRKVDDLQKKMLAEYFDYMTSSELLKMANESLNGRAKNYEAAKKLGNESLMVADAYYRVALDRKSQYEMDFLSKRAALEQIVGMEALQEFEKALLEREKSKNKKTK